MFIGAGLVESELLTLKYDANTSRQSFTNLSVAEFSHCTQYEKMHQLPFIETVIFFIKVLNLLISLLWLAICSISAQF